MDSDQKKQVTVLAEKVIEKNDEMIVLLSKLKPEDQLYYADKVKELIFNSQRLISTIKA